MSLSARWLELQWPLAVLSLGQEHPMSLGINSSGLHPGVKQKKFPCLTPTRLEVSIPSEVNSQGTLVLV